MGEVKAYILSVCGAAILCAIACRLLNKNHAPSGIGKLILGIFLLLVVLQPVSNIYIDELQSVRHNVQEEALQAVQHGENISKESFAEIIKERTATYILQKAASLQLDITVDIHLSDDAIPAPEKVYITGVAAPYSRRQLQTSIEQDLGISKENQIWT